MVAVTFPSSDSGLLAWSQAFLNLITASPTTYGLVAGDATAYAAVNTAYSNALAACAPDMRSKSTVVAKDVAKTNLKNAANLLANKVYSTATVTDAQKTALGIPPRATPTVIPAPANAPVMAIKAVSGWKVTIQLKAVDSERRGKPAGVIGASVFSYTGANPPPDITQWVFQGSTGRATSIEVDFPTTLPGGTKVWLTAFWFNGRKESGPACTPLGTSLPGGTVSLAA